MDLKFTGSVLVFGSVLVALYLVISVVMAVPFWALWNWLVPSLFSGPALTFWQAVGLGLLLSLIASAFKTTSK